MGVESYPLCLRRCDIHLEVDMSVSPNAREIWWEQVLTRLHQIIFHKINEIISDFREDF